MHKLILIACLNFMLGVSLVNANTEKFSQFVSSKIEGTVVNGEQPIASLKIKQVVTSVNGTKYIGNEVLTDSKGQFRLPEKYIYTQAPPFTYKDLYPDYYELIAIKDNQEIVLAKIKSQSGADGERETGFHKVTLRSNLEKLYSEKNGTITTSSIVDYRAPLGWAPGFENRIYRYATMKVSSISPNDSYMLYYKGDESVPYIRVASESYGENETDFAGRFSVGIPLSVFPRNVYPGDYLTLGLARTDDDKGTIIACTIKTPTGMAFQEIQNWQKTIMCKQ